MSTTDCETLRFELATPDVPLVAVSSHGGLGQLMMESNTCINVLASGMVHKCRNCIRQFKIVQHDR